MYRDLAGGRAPDRSVIAADSAEIEASTTGCNSPPPAASSTAACSRSTCSRGDDHRPGQHLGGRDGSDRARCRDPAEYPAGGRHHIGAGAKVGPNCLLADTTVGDDAELINVGQPPGLIGAKATLGPNVYLRPRRTLATTRISAATSRSEVDRRPRAKVPHLTYVGDATIGAGANVGAGTIFANYDGATKSPTTVGEHAFVGSNSVLVAPVSIGDGGYTAAGSVIISDVPAGDLGIARGKQHTSAGWVERNRAGTRSAAAASRARLAHEGPRAVEGE